MATDSMDDSLSASDYCLSGMTGLGILLNVLLLIWHVFKFTRSITVSMKCFMILTDLSYFLEGLGLALFLLTKEFQDNLLCQIAGYSTMFIIQMSCCFLAMASVFLLEWRLGEITKKSEKRYGWLFLTIIVIELSFAAVLTFLPLMAVDVFDLTDETPFTCLPIRLVGQKGWAFSLMMLILLWMTICASLLCNTVSILTNKKKRWKRCKRILNVDSTLQDDSADLIARRTAIALFTETACWTAFFAIFTYIYFVPTQTGINIIVWLLSIYITGITLIHPIVHFAISFSLLKKSCHSCKHRKNKEPLHDKSPKELRNLITIPSKNKEISKFKIQWTGKMGQTLQGIMKVYKPSGRTHWMMEKCALLKLSKMEHPNILKCMWITKSNKYTEAIQTITGVITNPNNRIICMQCFEHGNLRQFLQTNVHKMTEDAARHISLDIANGLEHLQEMKILHNNLSTKTVWIAGSLQNMAVKAVIGDFENSSCIQQSVYAMEMLENHRPNVIHAITQEISNNQESQNLFAPDIRSYGLILLEILTSLSRFKLGISSTTRNKSKVENTFGKFTTQKAMKGQLLLQEGSNCMSSMANRQLPPVPEELTDTKEAEIDELLHAGFILNEFISGEFSAKSSSTSLNTCYPIQLRNGKQKRQVLPKVCEQTQKSSNKLAKLNLYDTPLNGKATIVQANEHQLTDGTSVNESMSTLNDEEYRNSSIATSIYSEVFEDSPAVTATDNIRIHRADEKMKCKRLASTSSMASHDSGIYTGQSKSIGRRTPSTFENKPRNRNTIYAQCSDHPENRFNRTTYVIRKKEGIGKTNRESFSSIDSGLAQSQAGSDYLAMSTMSTYSNSSFADSFTGSPLYEVDNELSDDEIYETIPGAKSDTIDIEMISHNINENNNKRMVSAPRKQSKNSISNDSETFCFDNDGFVEETNIDEMFTKSTPMRKHERISNVPKPNSGLQNKGDIQICEECAIDEHFVNHPLATVRPQTKCDHYKTEEQIRKEEDTISVNSLILDSDLIMDKIKMPDIEMPHNNFSLNQSLPLCESFNSSGNFVPPNNYRYDNGLVHMEYCKELAAMFLEIDFNNLTSGKKSEMKNMAQNIVARGNLGASAQQLMGLAEDCWLQQIVLKPGQILARLRRSV